MNSGNPLSQNVLKPQKLISKGGILFNWKNDPLLFRGKTANDLIKTGKQGLLFLDSNQENLNIYSALVRHEDFVKAGKRNQLLQKTAVARGDNLETKVSKFMRKNNISFTDSLKSLEFYTGNRLCIRGGIQKWFSKNAFPLVYLRALSLFDKNPENALASFVQVANVFTDYTGKSIFHCPKSLKDLLTRGNAYFCGCSVGDGHIEKSGRRWVLVDGTPDKQKLNYSLQFVNTLRIFLETNFVNKATINKNQNKFELKVNNKVFCRYINFFFSLPFGSKLDAKIKRPLIFDLAKNKQEIVSAFWRGCFDTDGYVAEYGALSFSSLSETLLNDCCQDLNSLGIPMVKRGSNALLDMAHCNRFKKVGFSHPRKQQVFLNLLKKGPSHTMFSGVNNKISPKPNAEILKAAAFLRPWGHKVRICFNNDKKASLSELEDLIKSVFKVKINRNSRIPFISSSKLSHFLQNNFVYKRAWESINKTEESQLRNYWNVI